MARVKARNEPLPLVPATCSTGGSLCSGWSSAASRRPMRPSERSIDCGCSFCIRSSRVSLDATRGRAEARPTLCGISVNPSCPSDAARRVEIYPVAGRVRRILFVVDMSAVEAVAGKRDRRGGGRPRKLAVLGLGQCDVVARLPVRQKMADAGERAARVVQVYHHFHTTVSMVV